MCLNYHLFWDGVDGLFKISILWFFSITKFEFTIFSDECSLEGEGSSGSGKRKTTEEVLAELENEAYIKPPMKKKLKKIGGTFLGLYFLSS